MIIILANLIVNLFGYNFDKAKRLAWLVLGAIAVLIVVGGAMTFRSCGGDKAVKIDEQSLQKINSDNNKERRAELQKVIEENQDVIEAVDERSNLAEVNRVE